MRDFPYLRTAPEGDVAKATSPSTQMAIALGATGKQVYGGTVSNAEKVKRRSRNKRARAARKVARR